MPSGFIDDGYTIDATIADEKGTYDPIRITYRPMLRRERWLHNKAVSELAKTDENGMPLRDKNGSYVITDIAALDDAIVKLLSEHLVGWSLRDRKGNPVAISQDNMLRLQPAMFNAILAEVLRSDEEDSATAKNS